MGERNAVCPVAKKINGETPRKVVMVVRIIGLARTLPASTTAVILSFPSLLSLLMKSTIISESLTMIPDNANIPIADRNLAYALGVPLGATEALPIVRPLSMLFSKIRKTDLNQGN